MFYLKIIFCALVTLPLVIGGIYAIIQVFASLKKKKKEYLAKTRDDYKY